MSSLLETQNWANASERQGRIDHPKNEKTKNETTTTTKKNKENAKKFKTTKRIEEELEIEM